MKRSQKINQNCIDVPSDKTKLKPNQRMVTPRPKTRLGAAQYLQEQQQQPQTQISLDDKDTRAAAAAAADKSS